MPGVFLVGDDKKTLVKMTHADYLNEDDLQLLIATHPALLGGCTAEKEGEERELLLVKREMGVPDQENGNDRWSLDHLYIDQNCVPTLVEVKRSKSSDMRRAVVGQLMDYAANGAVYWSTSTLKDSFARHWGAEAEAELDAFLEKADLEEEEFWNRVQANFEERNLRIVFVADELPPQLKRVIEFLNEEMRNVEVLGVELRQFRTEDKAPPLRAIAPSVIGRTSQAQIVKRRGAGVSRTFDELDSVVAEYRKLVGGEVPAVDGRSGHYRQIHLGADIPKGFHYEFQWKVRSGLLCEFHAEVSPRPSFNDALKAIADSMTTVGSSKLEFLPRGRTVGLRVIPAKQNDPAAVAKAMADFIRATRAPIEKAIRASR
jgi:hypothetical protein